MINDETASVVVAVVVVVVLVVGGDPYSNPIVLVKTHFFFREKAVQL